MSCRLFVLQQTYLPLPGIYFFACDNSINVTSEDNWHFLNIPQLMDDLGTYCLICILSLVALSHSTA